MSQPQLEPLLPTGESWEEVGRTSGARANVSHTETREGAEESLDGPVLAHLEPPVTAAPHANVTHNGLQPGSNRR